MAVPTTKFFNGVASIDRALGAVIRAPFQDLVSAATLKVRADGFPDLDHEGNQEGFHPYGAIFAATVIAAAVLGASNAVCNAVVPYFVRSHVILATKIATGVCLFKLIGVAIESIRTQTQGDPSKRQC